MKAPVKHILRYILFPFESVGFLFAYVFFRVFPLRLTQIIAAYIGRSVGKLHPASEIIYQNLNHTNTSVPDKKQFAQDVWANFTMLAAEYTHTHSYKDIIQTKLTVEGIEHLKEYLQAPRAGICLSAHIGNWALGTSYIHAHTKRKLAMIHRPPNNAFVNAMFHYIQKPFADIIVEKNSSAGQRLFRLLNQNTDIVMLNDQKNNTGISLPFLDQPAMTTTGPALLTYKQNRPILPFICVRHLNGMFTLKFAPIVWPHEFKNHKNPIEKMTEKLNSICSQWIREVGPQWFWLHKRYPRELYKTKL